MKRFVTLVLFVACGLQSVCHAQFGGGGLDNGIGDFFDDVGIDVPVKDEHKDDFAEQKENLRRKYGAGNVEFGHKYKYSNAAEYTLGYFSGDWATTTHKIAKVAGEDYTRFKNWMERNHIDPRRERVYLAFGPVNNWARLREKINGNTTVWNKMMPEAFKYIYVERRARGPETSAIAETPANRTVTIQSLACVDQQESTPDDIYFLISADGSPPTRFPRRGSINFRERDIKQVKQNVTFSNSVSIQVWEKDLRKNDLLGTRVLNIADYSQSDSMPFSGAIAGFGRKNSTWRYELQLSNAWESWSYNSGKFSLGGFKDRGNGLVQRVWKENVNGATFEFVEAHRGLNEISLYDLNRQIQVVLKRDHCEIFDRRLQRLRHLYDGGPSPW